MYSFQTVVIYLRIDGVHTTVQITNELMVFMPVYNLQTDGVYTSVQFTNCCYLYQCTVFKLLLFIPVYSLQTDGVFTSVQFKDIVQPKKRGV